MIKSIAALLIVMIFCFISCTKDNTPPTSTPPSKMDLLTRKQWIYDELYSYYNGSTGKLVYKRGVTNDPARDAERDIYWADSTADQISDYNNSHYLWSWHFVGTDSTRFVSSYNGTSNPCVIQVLDETHFQYYDTAHSIMGKMILKN